MKANIISHQYTLPKKNLWTKKPIYYRDTIYYIYPISRQTYPFATEIACDCNPANIVAIDTDGKDYCRLTPTPVKQDPPIHFNTAEIQSTIQPNTFSAHTACLYSSKH